MEDEFELTMTMKGPGFGPRALRTIWKRDDDLADVLEKFRRMGDSARWTWEYFLNNPELLLGADERAKRAATP